VTELSNLLPCLGKLRGVSCCVGVGTPSLKTMVSVVDGKDLYKESLGTIVSIGGGEDWCTKSFGTEASV
jgi:hypothetical protein